MNAQDTNLPMTVICSKAVEDITETLENVQTNYGITSDLMVMICRDIMGHFERKRAQAYCNSYIKQNAEIDALKREIDALKQMSGIFEGVNDDHTEN